MLRRHLVAFSLLAPLLANAVPAVGQAAPDFSAKDANGKAVRLSDYRGKYVVLEWTNPGCPFVRKHYNSGNMPATQAEAIRKGAVWLSIDSTAKSSDEYMEPAKVASWQKERQAQPTALLTDGDGAIGR